MNRNYNYNYNYNHYYNYNYNYNHNYNYNTPTNRGKRNHSTFHLVEDHLPESTAGLMRTSVLPAWVPLPNSDKGM